MNALVTGATGFLGSRVVHTLLNAGFKVRIYRRKTSNLILLESVAAELEHSIGDITDEAALSAAMKEIQIVFHVAGNVRFGSKSLDRVNVQGTTAVVNTAINSRIERLVHTSSVSAVGASAEGPSDESTKWETTSELWPYGRSKTLAELEILKGVHQGLDAVMVNPGLIFGPDHSKGKALNVTHEYALKIRDRSIRAYPSGGTNVVDVDDVAAGHLAALKHGETGARYILGSENLTWKAIFTQLAKAMGTSPPKISIPYPLALVAGSAADFWSAVTGRNFAFGRSAARYTLKNRQYSNLRAIQELGCSFRPFSETAQRVADSLNS